MANQEPTIPLSEAAAEVELVSRRLGLLHLAFAKTLVQEFGEQRGKELILQAIRQYGIMVGEKAKADVQEQGLEPVPANFAAGSARSLPKIGMHEKGERLTVDGQARSRAYGCAMAKVWREYGEEELGSLYCFVDPAKYLAYNPDFKYVHTRSMPVSGGDYCEFTTLPTTPAEREAFFANHPDWVKMDGNIPGRDGK